jgi:hypothetical protein
MMVGSKQVFFMDEISTGLDSSTTYAIVKFLRDQTHALNYTTMISLLQPAPESYDLFDDILLMAEGGTSLPGYASPASFASFLPFFASCLFVFACPWCAELSAQSNPWYSVTVWLPLQSLPAHVRLHMTAVVAQGC